jgi:hypothetical protein
VSSENHERKATDDDVERPVPDPAGPSARLTHAQRVERVNAYLKASASRGIWSAIE